MRILKSLKRRLAESVGAVTEEFSFLTLIALAIVGVLLFFIKSGPFAALLARLFTDLFTKFFEQIAGLFS